MKYKREVKFEVVLSFDFEGMLKEMEELITKLRDVELEETRDTEQIDELDVKGYTIRGRFKLDQPWEPLNPFEPFNPQRRLPRPERPFITSERAPINNREPLTDVYDGENEIKIYVELPIEEENIYLNITKGEVEIKAKNFYKTIKIPVDIDIEKASSKQRNSVLEIKIPKRKNSHANEIRSITIE